MLKPWGFGIYISIYALGWVRREKCASVLKPGALAYIYICFRLGYIYICFRLL
jgi:hypothetical protein